VTEAFISISPDIL